VIEQVSVLAQSRSRGRAGVDVRVKVRGFSTVECTEVVQVQRCSRRGAEAVLVVVLVVDSSGGDAAGRSDNADTVGIHIKRYGRR